MIPPGMYETDYLDSSLYRVQLIGLDTAFLGAWNSFKDIAIDGGENSYILTESVTNSVLLMKYDNLGNSVWSRRVITSPVSPIVPESICLDSFNMVYITGYYQNGSYTESFVIKLDQDGNIVWNKSINTASSSINSKSVKIIADSNTNVYITGTINNNIQLIKLDGANGSIVWQKELGSSSTNTEEGKDIAINSNGDVYLLSTYRNSSAQYKTQLTKFDSAGTLLWQRRYYEFANTPNMYPQSITIDSSNNVYFSMMNEQGKNIEIIKLDSSDTQIFRGRSEINKFIFDASSKSITRMQILPVSNYISMFGSLSSGSGERSSLIMQKQDTVSPGGAFVSHTLFDKFFTEQTLNNLLNSTGYTTSSYLYFAGQLSGYGNRIVVFKLPVDGSKAGIYHVNNTSFDYNDWGYVEIENMILASSHTNSDMTATNTSISTYSLTLVQDSLQISQSVRHFE